MVILTGAGGHFSAGGDVKTMAAKRHTAAEGRARVESLNRFVIRLFEFPKPTIAMVDGFAVGAGCNIALGCDMLIASDRARFGEVFAKIGLVPDGGGTWLLPRLVGLAKAKELVFSADIIDAAEALRIGLVNRVVPAAELESDDAGARRAASRRARPARSASPRRCSTAPPRWTWRRRSASRPTPRRRASPPRTTPRASAPSSRSARPKFTGPHDRHGPGSPRPAWRSPTPSSPTSCSRAA